MAYRFKIQLKDIQKPTVWRRVLVPENITFNDFHLVIQAAFGWDNCHLYQFSKQGWGSRPIYKIPYEEDDMDIEDSYLAKISEVFSTPKQKFTYIYDFGDDWNHSIMLEEILDEKILMPMCIGGKGACPPEDCGGMPGYYNLIEILNNPKSPESREMKEWLGLGKNDKWDVNEFDLEIANARCSKSLINDVTDDDDY